MNSHELTTRHLLNLEAAGVVITSGEIPIGLNLRSSLAEWFAMFPNVSKELVEAWSDYARAKTILHDTIVILNLQK